MNINDFTEARLLSGTRVRLIDNHPWCGECGYVSHWEQVALLDAYRPVVEMDNGFSCLVIRAGDVELLEANENDQTPTDC